MNVAIMLYYQQQRYFVSEALAAAQVRVDELDGKLLVTFRQMTVREIDPHTGQSAAILLPVKSATEKPRAVETVEKPNYGFSTVPTAPTATG